MTLIPSEGLIDKRIDQAVKWSSDSQTYGKYAAIATARVGDYSGATEQIAQRTKRSDSTVYNWANAFNLYKIERKENRPIAWKLWRELPISFWWIAWGFHKSGYEALEYLLKAYQHGWKTRDMVEEYKRDVEAGTAPLQLPRVKATVRGLALELLKHPTLFTRRCREALQIVIEELT